MHPCLHVPELRYLIARQLDFEPATLLSLALTCRAMTDPCTDALWLRQNSLYNLIKTMPEDLWGEDFDHPARSCRRSITGTDLRFNRSLRESDWMRYNYYSMKVRRITLWDGTLGLQLGALLALCAYRPQQDLLPNLYFIQISFPRSTSVTWEQYATILLGNTVREIHVEINDDELHSDTFLETIPRLCPNITDLTVEKYTDSCLGFELLGHVSKTVILRLSNLKCIRAALLDVSKALVDYFRSLTSLHTLGELVVRHETNHAYDDMNENDFASLETLCLAPFEWGAVFPVLQRFRSCPKLTVLVVDYPGEMLGQNEAPIPSLEDFFVEIGSFHNLTHLSLSGFDSDDDLENEEIEKVFATLFALRSLRSFRIESPLVSGLGDAWAAQLARAFPNLRNLALQTREVPGDVDPRMTLEGLLPIILNCQLLYTLQVTVTCRPFDLALVSPSQTRIESVEFVCSPLYQASRLPQCMRAMFPFADITTGYLGWEDEAWVEHNLIGQLEGRFPKRIS